MFQRRVAVEFKPKKFIALENLAFVKATQALQTAKACKNTDLSEIMTTRQAKDIKVRPVGPLMQGRTKLQRVK